MESEKVAYEIKESDIKFESTPIGSGAFGKVYKGTLIQTGQIIAVKKVLQDSRYKNRELSSKYYQTCCVLLHKRKNRPLLALRYGVYANYLKRLDT